MADIQWYPGHMAKTKRLIIERIKLVDIVFELLDARAPLSSQNPLIREITSNKPRLIILNKADLADKNMLDKWIKHFESNGFTAIKTNSLKGSPANAIIKASKILMEDVFEKERKRGRLPRPVRAMILGIPNVGKSTLINALVSKRVTKVGDVPGVTKHLQMIRIHQDLELLDTPGILWPKFDDKEVAIKLALLGTLKDHLLPLDEVVGYGLSFLMKYYREAFEKRYELNITKDDDMHAIFDLIGERRGCIKQGGKIDYDRVIDLFLHDFRHQKFGNIILDRLNKNV